VAYGPRDGPELELCKRCAEWVAPGLMEALAQAESECPVCQAGEEHGVPWLMGLPSTVAASAGTFRQGKRRHH